MFGVPPLLAYCFVRLVNAGVPASSIPTKRVHVKRAIFTVHTDQKIQSAVLFSSVSSSERWELETTAWALGLTQPAPLFLPVTLFARSQAKAIIFLLGVGVGFLNGAFTVTRATSASSCSATGSFVCSPH